MSPLQIEDDWDALGFPRPRGDEPLMNAAWWYYVPFSPPTRG